MKMRISFLKKATEKNVMNTFAGAALENMEMNSIIGGDGPYVDPLAPFWLPDPPPEEDPDAV